MTPDLRPLDTIQDIKKMMERSSRFISLSGWSGVSAGICALIGAWLAKGLLVNGREPYGDYNTSDIFIDHAKAARQLYTNDLTILLNTWLFWIAVGTFAGAFISAFFFTWVETKKQGIAIWGATSRRLLINVMVPMITGGIFLLRAIQLGYVELIAPGCLIFYGLALINGSKYTLGEIRYLGLAQLVLGIFNLWLTGYGLYFWALGFGVMHIVYGMLMWWRHERGAGNDE